MWDSLILMVMALVVFGPRRLPQIGRQIGKLMYEFRKASNDFKFQMEEELRNSEDADRRKKEEERLPRWRWRLRHADDLRRHLRPPDCSPDREPGAPVRMANSRSRAPIPERASIPTSHRPTYQLPSSHTPRIQPPSTGEPVSPSRQPARAIQPMRPASAEREPQPTDAARPQARPHRSRSKRHTMVDPADAIGKAREAVSQRAELPGMSLMEHLDELRKRIVHSAIYPGRGLHRGLGLSRPLRRLHPGAAQPHRQVADLHPPHGPLNLDLQVSLVGGAILASPFILYQVWLFIAPGLYQKERRFVVPFMAATVGLFLAGAAFGYFFVLPGALKILIVDFGHNFTSMVTIEEYTSFFLSIILGLGISFEMPILIFFLALFGIVSPRFLWKNIRYAILAVFLVAAIICPSPDPWTMCIYAVPMLALYLIGIGVAWWVHPSRRKERRRPPSEFCSPGRDRGACPILRVLCSWVRHDSLAAAGDSAAALLSARAAPRPAQHFNGAKALEYAREFVAIGPRWPTGPGHLKAEDFLRDHFKHDQLEEDTFTADTPIGPVPMRNFIVRFPGKKDGVIVLATHYETNYWLRNINFVGANDGGSTTGLLMAIADQLRAADGRRQKARRLLGLAALRRRRRGHSELVRLRLDLRQPPSRRQMGPRRNARPASRPSSSPT